MKKLISAIFIISLALSGEQQIGQLNGFDVSLNRVVLKVSAEIAPKLGQEAPLTIEFSPELKSYIKDMKNPLFSPLFQGYKDFNGLHYTHDLHQYY
ncbi:MAG: hypothetical protein HOB17_00320 [Candidatus Marinimicrobia bacterium]|jgi:small nuclear ribonucleoprotein (snRNP)-like protein|nr:hypothetical protein [Candidatus Neomarinimicrobiota bacterium]MBT3683927.1 hypothetical protein [Candidatus Neomarinimicrobiota bacterium]MBT3760851.1 hypothetical protein [Candidatus Neomarinimicrobiota bacterium]MBT3896769.1 hypothetical protein [Candidatus Neomarinimicrobiota bacterium]MBT4173937.1 hypothetical protein [Candidatus Neomarinimicrobiota bacterium]